MNGSLANLATADRPASYPLSPGQRRVWFLEQLNPGLPIYNEADAVRLVGELDIDKMERALNIVIARHDVLRTTFWAHDNQPVAVVHESWPLRLRKIDLAGLAGAALRKEVERLLLDEPRQIFHLEAEPGVRATILRLGAREHVFILTMHHIVCDARSMGILWREFAAAYHSICHGEPPALPTLMMQHRDYAISRVEQTNNAGFMKDLAFWAKTLHEAPPILELPADRPRPLRPSYAGARQRLFLSSTVTQSLRDFARRAGTSLFTVFAAALNALLYRYTGKEDILLGIPISDRDRKELHSVIGFLLQTHVLRTQLSGDTTVRTLLTRVQKLLLNLHIHRAAPFDEIVRALQPERDLSYSPLFQVMLTWRDRQELPSSIGLEGFVVQPAFAEAGTSKFDLTLFVTDCGDEIWLEIEYSTDLFDEGRIARMAGHYQTLLESAAGNPDRRIGELPLLTEAEREQVLSEWNHTGFAYPRDRMLHELVEEQAGRAPDAVAVVFEDQQLTYRELDDRANLLAAHLQDLGVGPNILVGICVERSLEMLVGLLGILKAGGAYVPLDPAYPAERLAFMVDDCQPRVLLTQKRLRTRLPSHRAEIVCLDAPFGQSNRNGDWRLRRNGCQAGKLAYVLYTSGSTGKPKGVQVSNRALVNFLSAMQREPGLGPGDTLLAVTTLSFDIAGLELFLPLISGARVIIVSREAAADGVRLAGLMERWGVSVMQATPATWRLLLEGGWVGSPALKILCGGEAWPPALADELLPRCESLWNMYGPTETTIWSSATRVEAGKPVLIGYPIANTMFYVLDARLQPVPIGVPGELYIGGDGLAEGYLNRPDLTKERFVSDPFSTEPGARLYRTGDMVRRLADGRIEFLHRADHQVKIRGFRIELGEIEDVLLRHPAVHHAAIVACEATPGDKRLVAYYTAEDNLSAEHLRMYLATELPEYMVPVIYVRLDALPLTPNGKLDRDALPIPKTTVSDLVRYEAPASEAERKIAEIWQDVLGIAKAGRDDNFFDLGGHSLTLMMVVARLRKAFDQDIRMVDMFQYTTVRALAKHLAGSADSSVRDTVRTEDHRPTEATRRHRRIQRASANGLFVEKI